MMKKLLLGITMFCLWSTFAQVEPTTNDTIFTITGELIKGQVSKVSSKTIHFNYPDENVVNELEVSTIAKIIFANGRVQNFSKMDGLIDKQDPLEEVEDISLTFEENSLSILPFIFIKGSSPDNEASEIATDHAYEFILSALEEDSLVLQETIVTAKRLDAYAIDLNALQKAEISALRKAVQTEYILQVIIEECAIAEAGITNDVEHGITIHLKLYNAESDVEIYESATTQSVFAKTSTATKLAVETSWKNGLDSLLQHFLAFQENE